MPRLFVAVWPPEDVLDAVADLPRPDVAGLRWTARDQWHVTLRFLGSVDSAARVVDALDSLTAPTAEVVLGPAVARFGRQVLHVPVSNLERVAAEVQARTASIGKPNDGRPFHGHLTLARARDRRGIDLRPLCGTAIAAQWRADRVCVVRSDLQRTGARYTTEAELHLARFDSG
jgi:RNA 2',3'-cyclic 3'-phosphodiesterase